MRRFLGIYDVRIQPSVITRSFLISSYDDRVILRIRHRLLVRTPHSRIVLWRMTSYGLSTDLGSSRQRTFVIRSLCLRTTDLHTSAVHTPSDVTVLLRRNSPNTRSTVPMATIRHRLGEGVATMAYAGVRRRRAPPAKRAVFYGVQRQRDTERERERKENGDGFGYRRGSGNIVCALDMACVARIKLASRAWPISLSHALFLRRSYLDTRAYYTASPYRIPPGTLDLRTSAPGIYDFSTEFRSRKSPNTTTTQTIPTKRHPLKSAIRLWTNHDKAQ